jgi:hypothetical protein
MLQQQGRSECADSTRDRSKAVDGPLLVLHDTTEFIYQRDRPEKVGKIDSIKGGHKYGGHALHHLLRHSHAFKPRYHA